MSKLIDRRQACKTPDVAANKQGDEDRPTNEQQTANEVMKYIKTKLVKRAYMVIKRLLRIKTKFVIMERVFKKRSICKFEIKLFKYINRQLAGKQITKKQDGSRRSWPQNSTSLLKRSQNPKIFKVEYKPSSILKTQFTPLKFNQNFKGDISLKC